MAAVWPEGSWAWAPSVTLKARAAVSWLAMFTMYAQYARSLSEHLLDGNGDPMGPSW